MASSGVFGTRHSLSTADAALILVSLNGATKCLLLEALDEKTVEPH